MLADREWPSLWTGSGLPSVRALRALRSVLYGKRVWTCDHRGRGADALDRKLLRNNRRLRVARIDPARHCAKNRAALPPIQSDF